MIDEALLQYATDTQKKYLAAVSEHGGIRKAAKALGVHNATIQKSLIGLKRRAASKGYSPEHDLTKAPAPGFTAKGHSTLYDLRKPGAPPLLQWVKTTRDDELQEQIARETIKALSEDIKGTSPTVESPERCHLDLLTIYPMGDPHFGMLAWAKETGEAFDSEEARRLTLGAIDRLVDAAPPSGTAIILPLGDVFHADDQTNQTPSHKNQLDVDSRYVKVLHIGIQTFRHAILRALEKHDRVIVRFVQGNHDPHAIWALAFSIAAYFDNQPRVEVDLSPSKFWFHVFGKCLIGATHGDTVKPDQLLGVMATDMAHEWGH